MKSSSEASINSTVTYPNTSIEHNSNKKETFSRVVINLVDKNLRKSYINILTSSVNRFKTNISLATKSSRSSILVTDLEVKSFTIFSSNSTKVKYVFLKSSIKKIFIPTPKNVFPSNNSKSINKTKTVIYFLKNTRENATTVVKITNYYVYNNSELITTATLNTKVYINKFKKVKYLKETIISYFNKTFGIQIVVPNSSLVFVRSIAEIGNSIKTNNTLNNTSSTTLDYSTTFSFVNHYLDTTQIPYSVYVSNIPVDKKIEKLNHKFNTSSNTATTLQATNIIQNSNYSKLYETTTSTSRSNSFSLVPSTTQFLNFNTSSSDFLANATTQCKSHSFLENNKEISNTSVRTLNSSLLCFGCSSITVQIDGNTHFFPAAHYGNFVTSNLTCKNG